MTQLLSSYKNRNKLLVIAAVVFAFIVFRLAIAPTITLFKETATIKSEFNRQLSEQRQISLYEKEIKRLNTSIGTTQKIDSNTEQNLLESISNYCKDKNVLLKEFPRTIKYHTQNYIIENHIFKLQGGFINILEFVYQLEQSYKIGKIISLQFQSTKDLKTQNIYLVATIYLQKIKALK